jgi:hypothetical protein
MTGSILYLERLSPRDIAFLARSAGEPPARLRESPERIDHLLASPAVFHELLRAESPFLLASPFLLFAVMLARTSRELEGVQFVPEWVGPRQWVPVFDVETLREFVADPLRRLFLADLLASYTHVVSGSTWVRTRRGWARRRFSELDPVRLAEFLDVVPEPERLAVYRRLGDLALFLSGVFPDYADERLFRPVQIERIERLVPADGEPDEPRGALGLLERLGRRSYRAASDRAVDPSVGLARVLGEVAERFAHARRILNSLTQRYLFSSRDDWFPLGA